MPVGIRVVGQRRDRRAGQCEYCAEYTLSLRRGSCSPPVARIISVEFGTSISRQQRGLLCRTQHFYPPIELREAGPGTKLLLESRVLEVGCIRPTGIFGGFHRRARAPLGVLCKATRIVIRIFYDSSLSGCA